MLFTYEYVTHSMEAFQEWLKHLVIRVWCRSSGMAYSLTLLHPDLQAVIKEVADDASITKDHLDGPIKSIDKLCQLLTHAQRSQLCMWFQHNNDIAALCANAPGSSPGTYDDIHAIDPALATELKKFCQSLFTDIIHLKAVTSRIGEIDQHYRAFVTHNKEDKCPYCGYSDLKGRFHSRRDAYDHYLPKAIYPFNTVNFHNLAPMCHECNSSYKLSRNPLMHIDPLRKSVTRTRRKAFYSYETIPCQIGINIALRIQKSDTLCPDDIKIQFVAPGHEEEIETWKEIFGIEERYKAKCCAENDGKAWLQHVIEECENGDLTKQQLLEQAKRAAQRRPFDGINFLKRPFLKACDDARLI